MFTQLSLFGDMEEQPAPKPATEVVKRSGKLVPPEIIEIEPAITSPAPEPVRLISVTRPAPEPEPISESISSLTKTTVIRPQSAIPESAPKKSKRGRKSIREMSLAAASIEIPADEILYTRQYYGIGEVAAMFRVNPSLLRYWEAEFDLLKLRKNRKGDRFFRPDDIKQVQRIYHLLRERKYTIEGAKDFMKRSGKTNEKFEAIETLKKIRDFLLELKAGLSAREAP